MNPNADIALELSRIEREAWHAVERRMVSSQLGEAFIKRFPIPTKPFTESQS